MLSKIAATLALTHCATAYKTARDSGYGAPAPVDNYGAPETGYGAPEPSYAGYEATGAGSPDITPILIGILVITGLALLFPSYVTLTSTRRKRAAVEGIQGESDGHN